MLFFNLLALAAANVLRLKASPAESNLDGTYIIEFKSSSTHCEIFEPVFQEAVEASAHLPVKFASIDCESYPDLCKFELQDLPILQVWRNGREQELRPSTHSSAVLAEFFEKISEGPLPEPIQEYDEEGNPLAERQTRKYEPYTQQQGVPIPVYPRQFNPVFAKGEVVALTPQNFEEVIINSGEPWMVKFYSPKCPYSRAMAAEWQRYTDTGLFNIAEFDCLQDINFCLANGVQFWPTIQYINKNYRREYMSVLEIPQWESFHQMQSGGQIIPSKDTNDVKALIDGAASKGYASFIYFHDDSTVFEDWDALVNQTAMFSDAQSVVLRSNDEQVRQDVGLNYAGTNLVFAGKTVDENDEDQHYYYTFEDGHEPITIRDHSLVSEWVNRVRFSQPILLNTSQLYDINEYADIHAILIAHNTRHDKFKSLRKASRHAYEAGLELRKNDQKRLRETRKKMHQDLKAEGKVNLYRKVYTTPIDVPFRANISYSYIPKDQWDEQFGDLIDTSNHENGDIILVNFAENIYADTLNGAKLESFNPDALISDAKPMLKSTGLEVKERPPVEFKVDFGFGDKFILMGYIKWIILFVTILVAILIVAKVALTFRTRYYSRLPAKLD